MASYRALDIGAPWVDAAAAWAGNAGRLSPINRAPATIAALEHTATIECRITLRPISPPLKMVMLLRPGTTSQGAFGPIAMPGSAGPAPSSVVPAGYPFAFST
jgi:hypothetical protein